MSGQKIIAALLQATGRDMVERWAMKLAVGNNGGTWDSHYTEKQKDHWRAIASEFIDEFTR